MLHLLHPALVHFSVAFLVAGGTCEVWAILSRREALGRWAAQLVLIGLATLVPTIVSGYLAANTVVVPGQTGDVLDAHERNGWFLLGLVLASQFWKAWNRGSLPGWQRSAYALLMVGIIAMTVYGAWLGGTMVYVHGIGVR